MTVIQIVIGAFGTVAKGLVKDLEELEIRIRVETIQTTAMLRSARILRRVLETNTCVETSQKSSEIKIKIIMIRIGMTLESKILECHVTSISYDILKNVKKEKVGIEQLWKINESSPWVFRSWVNKICLWFKKKHWFFDIREIFWWTIVL